MIYIPDKNVEWSEVENLKDNIDGLKWRKVAHWTYYVQKENRTSDNWFPVDNEFTITMICYDNPLYNEILCLNGRNIMKCGCYCLPQLRYNKEWNKWSCTCPSSFIENNDKEEMKQIKEDWYDNPVKAILKWNMKNAESVLKYNQQILQQIS